MSLYLVFWVQISPSLMQFSSKVVLLLGAPCVGQRKDGIRDLTLRLPSPLVPSHHRLLFSALDFPDSWTLPFVAMSFD